MLPRVAKTPMGGGGAASLYRTPMWLEALWMADEVAFTKKDPDVLSELKMADPDILKERV